MSPTGPLPTWVDSFWGAFNLWAGTVWARENTGFIHYLQDVYRKFHGKKIYPHHPLIPNSMEDKYLRAMNEMWTLFIDENSASDANILSMQEEH